MRHTGNLHNVMQLMSYDKQHPHAVSWEFLIIRYCVELCIMCRVLCSVYIARIA